MGDAHSVRVVNEKERERRAPSAGRTRRRRREDRGAEGAEGVGCEEGVSPSPRGRGLGRGLCPLLQKIF